MKLIKTTGHQASFTFQLSGREKDLLLHVLDLYPLVPTKYQPLSKSGQQESASQDLLDEALEQERTQSKKKLKALVDGSSHLQAAEEHWLLTLSTSEVDWLLLVLNDIRLGSWVLLGSPENPLESLTTQSAPHFWAMEMAGLFQSHFLELLDN